MPIPSLQQTLDYFKGKYELHLTTQCHSEDELRQFKSFCTQVGAKVLLIQLPQGQVQEQPMLSLYLNTPAYSQIRELESQLQASGFKHLRTKVEAHPSNKNIPQDISNFKTIPSELYPDTMYFEQHLKVILTSNHSHLKLTNHLKKEGAHLSRNALKTPNKPLQHFITQRLKNTGLTQATQRLQALIHTCEKLGLQIESTFQEFVIYDNHIALDKGWNIP